MDVKICGLSTPQTVAAAVEARARYVGFVFFPSSPRAVTPEAAAALATEVPPGVAKVGLFVDPSDENLDAALAVAPLDFVQIHKVASPERLAAIRARAGLPLIAALPVSEEADFNALPSVARVADMILFDAKPPKDAKVPGGRGVSFDWRLLAGRRIGVPWMLAGGLTPENVARAINLSSARAVDVSSGVEDAPGAKSVEKIAAFMRAAG